MVLQDGRGGGKVGGKGIVLMVKIKVDDAGVMKRMFRV